ncbi:hypothetical protein QBC34DRAFT_492767 [Podospora aff. communis PSN243]|uniref:Uncharacterized protein n=1 Tax=Podospora aff. communis PSN243 TaxID=3040156 RepID=A0AAV9GUE7_9PEZI|nr:hypothetical protein QBC34DRAFT_492767 [Podospora aff. communis PSN243]
MPLCFDMKEEEERLLPHSVSYTRSFSPSEASSLEPSSLGSMITLTFSCFLEFPVAWTPDGDRSAAMAFSFFLQRRSNSSEKKKPSGMLSQEAMIPGGRVWRGRHPRQGGCAKSAVFGRALLNQITAEKTPQHATANNFNLQHAPQQVKRRASANSTYTTCIRDILRFPAFFFSWKPVAAGEGDEAVRPVVDQPANSEARPADGARLTKTWAPSHFQAQR